MFRHHFKITLRLLMRNKRSSFINISGLAIGLAACILISLYIQYELSYDRYNKKADRIFRLTEQSSASGRQLNYAQTPEQLAPLLQSNFPQIEFAARMVQMSHYVSAFDDVLVTFQHKQFYEKNLYFTDPSLFKIFTLPVIEGNVENGLSRPNTIFISASIAKKYFGEQNAIGQILKIGDSQNYEVTGVFKDFPSNSHIHADFLASLASIIPQQSNGDWYRSVYTYLLLKNKQDAAGITKQFPPLINKYIPASPTCCWNSTQIESFARNHCWRDQ